MLALAHPLSTPLLVYPKHWIVLGVLSGLIPSQSPSWVQVELSGGVQLALDNATGVLLAKIGTRGGGVLTVRGSHFGHPLPVTVWLTR